MRADSTSTEAEARTGWCSDVPTFVKVTVEQIAGRLREFVVDASEQQIRAWRDSIPALQAESQRLLASGDSANRYSAILEYELPLESRRIDMIMLANGAVVVLELKGRTDARQVDLDQVSAYARDLRCYHQCCDIGAGGHAVHAVLVPMRARGYVGSEQGVHIVGPNGLSDLIHRLTLSRSESPVTREAFLASDAYRPLPTLVQAARELFSGGTLRSIHRARSFTDPAVESISRIVHDAARTKSRRLVLLTGVPGAGKTLVGLRVVHAHFLDDLAVARSGGKAPAPAVFLSGNGPLVEVLQYELRSAGGGGKVFVRGVKDYVKTYSRRQSLVPPEHVLVFDEAQRAWDRTQMDEKHGANGGRSEPDQLIEFAERIPEWCVVVGLVGGGQEIHVGEEAGIGQWADAIARSPERAHWTIHAPSRLEHQLRARAGAAFASDDSLNLDREIRFHLAQDLHRFVSELLEGATPSDLQPIAETLQAAGYHLRLTRKLSQAREYLRERYAKAPEARFGLLASSKDKSLISFGVPNDFQSTKRIRFGPWYSDAESADGGYSCRHLSTCVTEFGAQGLELDAALVAWGTDLILKNGKWSNERASKYLRQTAVRDPFRLRVNSYRVLLTRGRDGSVVFIPPLPELDETFEYFEASGFVGI